MNKKGLLVTIFIILLGVSLIVLTGCGETSKTNSVSNTASQETTQKIEKEENKTVENEVIENKTEENETATKKEYTYKNGVLAQIVDEEGKPKQADFVIDGVILLGNRHTYPDVPTDKSAIEYFLKDGYKKEGIISDFYLNEYINIYLNTSFKGDENDVKIITVPHKKVEELEKLSFNELNELAEEKGAILDYKMPDEKEHKSIGEFYVSMDYSEGEYDILFTYKEQIAYFITVNLTKEPVE